jgi:hypothetical protein
MAEPLKPGWVEHLKDARIDYGDKENVEVLLQIASAIDATLERTDREREALEVVCLCGSTRFADQHAIRRWELEQEGRGRIVVLMINYLPHWWAESQGWDGNDHFGERTGTKEMLDELHLRKIDLSDRVEIINPGGYVGESTANEINYALRTRKPVTYMEEELTGPGVAILAAQEDPNG